ncbi:MAG: gfo/Idh/MocA family oxidoreductase [Spirochaetaceae bacterium]|nr:MAG: gfo/Idh/MocA family oxidoreductase [Spirochaetaceae bacterium]
MSKENNPIRVGIIGLGRSGWGIHVDTIGKQGGRFVVSAVYDPDTDRRDQAAKDLGCRAARSVDDVLADPQVELVVVASPNAYHTPMTVQALEAGKHVICEKPFGLTTADVDLMLEAAKKSGTLLQPFQQRRFEPDFQKVKEIVESGVLGEIQLIRICWHNFKRRWDWQTMKSMSGGSLNNNGPHPIDHAMELFGGDDPEVWCEMRRCLCSGDAEDYLKLILSGAGRPTVEVELMDCVAYGQERWFVAGKSGGLRGTAGRLDWKWVDWSTMPDRPVTDVPTPDRSYNSEPLDWKSDSWELGGTADAGAGAAPAPKPAITMYDNLYAVIREGAEQAIKPESIRSRVRVLEKARAAGGFY